MSTTEETLVREALQQSTDDLAAPVQLLTRNAARNGRRLRLRRRVTVAVGSVCAAAAIAVPVVLALGPNPARDGGFATDPSTSLPEPPPITGQVGWWDMPASEMLHRLRDVGPAGRSYVEPVLTNEGENAPGEPVAEMRGWLAADVVAHGATAGGINLLLYAPGQSAEKYTCPGNLVSPDSCTEMTNGAGTTVGRQSVTTTGEVTVIEVVLRGPGGGLVYVAVSNSADDKWGMGSTVASRNPPLSLEQVTDIATSSAWTDWRPRRQ
ncbi:hypothetical protein ISU10_04870 [Nocardioides agariphilus]|jgi:hypothetical protein|uniref:Uncharacterized protein n=1 Tax=Nocardioides agariphilus TaxID=433664 RepID=A0A930VNJ5_9ACTN|nr:hypothetical protein [Nocardioides agariphilus]MBF4767095.1 hypothetical protein [Nocardioides agariphilus]